MATKSSKRSYATTRSDGTASTYTAKWDVGDTPPLRNVGRLLDGGKVLGEEGMEYASSEAVDDTVGNHHASASQMKRIQSQVALIETVGQDSSTSQLSTARSRPEDLATVKQSRSEDSTQYQDPSTPQQTTSPRQTTRSSTILQRATSLHNPRTRSLTPVADNPFTKHKATGPLITEKLRNLEQRVDENVRNGSQGSLGKIESTGGSAERVQSVRKRKSDSAIGGRGLRMVGGEDTEDDKMGEKKSGVRDLEAGKERRGSGRSAEPWMIF